MKPKKPNPDWKNRKKTKLNKKNRAKAESNQFEQVFVLKNRTKTS
jgi:hypothetical protein